MKIGAWIHTGGGISFESQIMLAAENGLKTLRSYDYGYAESISPLLKQHGFSLLGGMHIDPVALIEDWQSQVNLDLLNRYHDLGIPLEGICVGNELREGGDAPDQKRFTSRISNGLSNVIHTYRQWLDDHDMQTRLTYAMESINFDQQGNFHEWVWPLVDACDVVGVNLYPMGNDAWFTYDAFEVSRRFLQEERSRHDRLVLFEFTLRRILQQLEEHGKGMILTETGFPSAVGYSIESEHLVLPEIAPVLYEQAMREFLGIIGKVDREYNHPIQALYFYEWRDNLFHDKIWNIEQSPIHTSFGLCDRYGHPKFDIQCMIGEL